MDKTFMGFTQYDILELYDAVSYTFQETKYTISGPKSLQRAIHRNNRDAQDLIDRCGRLNRKATMNLVDRVYNPNREEEWDVVSPANPNIVGVSANG